MTPEPDKGHAEVPKFDTNWKKLRDQIPSFFAPPGWKDSLDSIATFWKDSIPDQQEKLKRFSSALALNDVPTQELVYSREYFDNTKQQLSGLISGINEIATGNKLPWKQIKEFASSADELSTGEMQDDQVIAILEAIHETAELNLTPEEMRQRIAQHVFEEIFLLGEHRIYEYSAAESGDDIIDRTTQDSLEDEKSELISAIKKEPWNAKTIKENAKIYRTWRRVIQSDSNSIDPELVYDQFEELWKATKAEGISRKSALHILQLGEDIHEEFESGEAFDIDLTEFYEDEDDEDQDE